MNVLLAGLRMNFLLEPHRYRTCRLPASATVPRVADHASPG